MNGYHRESQWRTNGYHRPQWPANGYGYDQYGYGYPPHNNGHYPVVVNGYGQEVKKEEPEDDKDKIKVS